MTRKGLLPPHECWSQWINGIASDNDVDRQRIIDHIKVHVEQHMPPKDAPAQRWTQWLTGTYNLLGILQQLTAGTPTFALGLDRLFRKWAKDPFDHTPPPTGLVDTVRTHCEST
jgi:hypothetical protein